MCDTESVRQFNHTHYFSFDDATTYYLNIIDGFGIIDAYGNQTIDGINSISKID